MHVPHGSHPILNGEALMVSWIVRAAEVDVNAYDEHQWFLGE
jgi:hypothetical protein